MSRPFHRFFPSVAFTGSIVLRKHGAQGVIVNFIEVMFGWQAGDGSFETVVHVEGLRRSFASIQDVYR